jgi:CheY-specific phosphatase CheX
MNNNLEPLLEAAAKAVFTTMLNYEVEIGASDGNFFDGQEHVAGSVGLTGTFNGMIYLYSSSAFARRITCAMFRMTDEEIQGNEMINDVIGELTNMIVGNVKSSMGDLANGCNMTIPSVVRGRDFRAMPVTGGVRKTVHFRCAGGKVLIEAFIKT